MSLLREALKRAALERQKPRPMATAAPRKPASAEPPTTALKGIYSTARTVDPLVVCHTAPLTGEAQQYANLRTHVLLALGAEKSRVVLVTSAVPDEGKSLTAANLAACLAGSVEGRVVIIDADLRTPRLHELLGVPRGRGLSEYLRGEAPIEAVLHSSPIEQVVVLPAGDRAAAPSHLLTSPRLRELIAALREQFDDIIIDSAPALPLADARALATLADGVLLVLRAGRTRRAQAEDAIQRLHGARLLGLVFNRARRAELQGYYGYGSGGAS